MKVITGYARGRNLATLPGADVTRPTTQSTKEALFSSIQFEIEGKRVLDLFAGCGRLVLRRCPAGRRTAPLLKATDRRTIPSSLI